MNQTTALSKTMNLMMFMKGKINFIHAFGVAFAG